MKARVNRLRYVGVAVPDFEETVDFYGGIWGLTARQIAELLGAHYDEDELAQLAALLDRLPGVDPEPGGCSVD